MNPLLNLLNNGIINPRQYFELKGVVTEVNWPLALDQIQIHYGSLEIYCNYIANCKNRLDNHDLLGVLLEKEVLSEGQYNELRLLLPNITGKIQTLETISVYYRDILNNCQKTLSLPELPSEIIETMENQFMFGFEEFRLIPREMTNLLKVQLEWGSFTEFNDIAESC